MRARAPRAAPPPPPASSARGGPGRRRSRPSTLATNASCASCHDRPCPRSHRPGTSRQRRAGGVGAAGQPPVLPGRRRAGRRSQSSNSRPRRRVGAGWRGDVRAANGGRVKRSPAPAPATIRWPASDDGTGRGGGTGPRDACRRRAGASSGGRRGDDPARVDIVRRVIGVDRRTAPPASRAGSRAPAAVDPLRGPPGLLGVVGQHPADHVLLAGGQVDLRRGQLAHGPGRTAHRSAAGPGPRPSDRPRCGATHAASRCVPARCVDPLEHAVHRVIGQRPDTDVAASTTAAGCAPRDQLGHLHLVEPQPDERVRSTPAVPAISRLPLRTTVISSRPGSTPPWVADSSSDARAPVET